MFTILISFVKVILTFVIKELSSENEMSDYKNLKKVIAISSMAAATIGTGVVVNADNVQQQSVSSQKPSITAKVSSESQSAKSGNEIVLKASSQSSSATSSVASSSSSKTDSKKTSSQSSAKDSSQNSKKNEANATSAVNTLENDANKYQDSSDAVTQSYAQEAQQWLSNLQTFMNGKDLSSPSELKDEINFLKNDMKSLQDTLNASWFNGSPEAKQIMQDQINADKAVLAYLTGQGQDTQPATSIPSM